jgi:Asp-tRNA(Asn)/Glu-tRNA(Gln) amidotransferase A subunit family amidase
MRVEDGMAAMDPADLGALDAHGRMARGEMRAAEYVEAQLRRIAARDPDIEAFAFFDPALPRAAAKAVDDYRASGRPIGALHGLTVGVKDIIDTADMPTENGTRIDAGRRPGKDATIVRRLREAGAIVMGKTVTTELAYFSPGKTRNPHDPERTPGGSSSGSAAAVAARMVPGAIGSQTVGSILRPAAYCGVVGLKGPHGLVPLEGVVPLAWSFDHCGPFARSVGDAMLMLSVLGDVVLEPVAVTAPRLVIGRQLFDRAEPALRRHLDAVLERLVAAGARVTELTLPAPFGEIHAAGQVMLEVEAASYHQPAFARHAADYGAGIAEAVRNGL